MKRLFSTGIQGLPIALLIAIFFAQGAWVAHKNGLTNDEALHIPAAVSYYGARDFRMNTEHPPLTKWLIGMPLAAAGVKSPIGGGAWNAKDQIAFSEEFWRVNEKNQLWILFAARLPLLILVSLSSVFAFLSAREIYGTKAGTLAIAIFAIEPNLIAHAALANSDAAIAAAVLASVYFTIRFAKTGSMLSFSLLMFFTAAAALTKFSGLAVPLCSIAIFAWLFKRGAFKIPTRIFRIKLPGKSPCGALCGFILFYLAFVAAALALAIPLAYAFTMKKITPENSPRFEERIDSAIPGDTPIEDAIAGALTAVPVQKETMLGIYQVFHHISLGHPAYLFGEFSLRGWWHYFPAVFFFKTPIAIMLLILSSAALTFAKPAKVRDFETALLIPVFIYSAIAIFSGMNFGVRHLLFVYPLLFVYASGALTGFDRIPALKKYGTAVCAALVLFAATSSLSQMPYPISYMNEFAGSPARRAYLLSDSNLDWGQGLPALKKWMDENGVAGVKLYYGNLRDNPAVYGLNATLVTPDDVLPRDFKPGNVYAVSLWVATGYSEITDVNLFVEQSARAHELSAAFLNSRPDEVIANGAIWIYDLRN